jgi:hypothetical protein
MLELRLNDPCETKSLIYSLMLSQRRSKVFCPVLLAPPQQMASLRLLTLPQKRLSQVGRVHLPDHGEELACQTGRQSLASIYAMTESLDTWVSVQIASLEV